MPHRDPEVIEKELQALDRQKQAIRTKQLALNAELTAAVEAQRAEARLAAMSDAEKSALAQALNLEGVATTEEVSELA